jgi:hypothetical protein
MATPRALCVTVVAVLLTGCGEEASRDGDAGTTVPVRAAPRTITEAESGESFTLSRGAETTLRLSGDYAWSEPSVRGDAVELARVDYLQDPGFSEWTILAVRPGTATLTARGTPDCAGQERCPEKPLRFQTTITVPP